MAVRTREWLGRLDDDLRARVEKLPQWAITLVNDQAHRIAGLQDMVQQLTSEHPESNVQAEPYSEAPFNLLPDTTISFRFPRTKGDATRFGKSIQVSHRAGSHGEPALYLNASGGGVRIEPWASNCFRVYPTDH